MPVSRVSGLGFYDTRTVTGLGFADETYTDTTTYIQPTGLSATTNIGTVAATTDSLILPSLSATVSLGTITPVGGATNVPVTGVSATTAIGIAELVTPMTNIKIGSVTPTEIHVGGTRIYKAYAGPNLVWYQVARATQYRQSTSTITTSTTTPYPANNYYRRYALAFTYTAAELAALDIIGGSVISKLRWYVFNPVGASYSPFPNYAIRMMHIGSGANNTNPTNLGGLSSSNVTDVKSQHNYDATPTGYHEMTLDNNFTYNGTDAIGFIFAWGQIPTGYQFKGQGYRLSDGALWYVRNDNPGTYLVTENASSSLANNRPVIGMYST
tara:strand:+ start:2339 stop:3316 length:978 start_codon:yes stop_codon:yes gene_type:complete